MSTRSEAFLGDAQARDNVTDAEMALDKDGNFLARAGEDDRQHGRLYAGRRRSPSSAISARSPGVYKTPTLHADITCAFTHTNPVRPYRGNGRPEAAYVIERLVDLAADQLGIDPAELRRRNTIPASAMPYKTGLTFTYDSGEFEKNMDLALELAMPRAFRRGANSRARTASCAG